MWCIPFSPLFPFLFLFIRALRYCDIYQPFFLQFERTQILKWNSILTPISWIKKVVYMHMQTLVKTHEETYYNTGDNNNNNSNKNDNDDNKNHHNHRHYYHYPDASMSSPLHTRMDTRRPPAPPTAFRAQWHVSSSPCEACGRRRTRRLWAPGQVADPRRLLRYAAQDRL